LIDSITLSLAYFSNIVNESTSVKL
jgi:hypothetical protein